MQSTLTILSQYDIQTTPEAFLLAIANLAARVKAEGHEGGLSYRFFSNPSQRQARAVIEYTGPSAWIGHHDISMNWPEMQALNNAARLVEITFLGEMTAEIQNWIDHSTLGARLNNGFDFAAGFHR